MPTPEARRHTDQSDADNGVGVPPQESAAETQVPKDADLYANPMSVLARSLGGGLEYPVPVSDAWLRVLFVLAPCGALILGSLVYSPAAPFLLTFAGAFASIQLASPYQRWMRRVAKHMNEAHDQHRTAIDWAKVQLRFHTSPKWFEGSRGVGYSLAERARARRRFPRLARRWRRRFIDLSGRVGMPGEPPAPAALPRWLYSREPTFDYMEFVRTGRTVPSRLVRMLLGAGPALWVWSSGRILDSKFSARLRSRSGEKVLQQVGLELIRATANRDGDLPVATLAEQLVLHYEKPEIQEGWVFRQPAQPVKPDIDER